MEGNNFENFIHFMFAGETLDSNLLETIRIGYLFQVLCTGISDRELIDKVCLVLSPDCTENLKFSMVEALANAGLLPIEETGEIIL